jgi:hypothetical protein
MEKVTKMDKRTVNAVMKHFGEIVRKEAEAIGMKLKKTRGVYSESGVTLRFELHIPGTEAAEAERLYGYEFKMWGLKYGDIVTCAGRSFKVTGFTRSGEKLTMESIPPDNKQWKVKPRGVLLNGQKLKDPFKEQEAKLTEEPAPPRSGIRMTVHDTQGKKDMEGFGELPSKPCECKESEFLCYPKDGACTCGTHQHHVHCAKCRGISQWG